MESNQLAEAPSGERTIMSVWPSISMFGVGQTLGRLYRIGPELSIFGVPARPGWLFVPLTLPLAILLYVAKIVPRIPFVLLGLSNPLCRRYRLTTNRIVVEHPFDAISTTRRGRSAHGEVALGDFDSVEIEEGPGLDWFRAGNLVFRQGDECKLRLPAVPSPRSFRESCLRANRSRIGVNAARKLGQAVAS